MSSFLNFFWSEKAKNICLVLIPISLIISIKLNSVVIILNFIVFTLHIYKNRKKKNRLSFPFVLIFSFLLSILIGFFIDIYYGIFNFKIIERYLSFFIFPLIFFIGLNKEFNFLKVVKPFSYFVTFLSFILVINAIYLTIKDSKTQFPDDLWIKSGSEIVNKINIADPLGNNEASRLIESTKNELHDITHKINGQVLQSSKYYRSVFIKSAGRDWVLIRQYDGVNHKGVWFNISKGYIGKKQKNLIGEIKDFGNGWYKCSVINITDSLATTERIQITIVDDDGKYKYLGDGERGVYIWGARISPEKDNINIAPSRLNINYRKFFRDNLLEPIGIHPTYYSLYVITSILFFIIKLLSKIKYSNIALLIFNSLIIILISSKGAIISLLIILSYLGIKSFKSKKLFSIMIIFLLTSILSSIFIFPNIKLRVVQTIDTILYDKNKNLSTSDRLIVWRSFLEFKNKDLLIGLGNENGNYILNKKTKLDLNTHNQYLQSLLSSGVLGLILLIHYLFSPLIFINSIKEEEEVFMICFMLLIVINTIFESVLYRQWGIIFIAFFYTLFFKYNLDKKKK